MQRAELLHTARIVRLGDCEPTFLKIEPEEIPTFATALYRLASNDILATSFVPVEFWRDTLGQLVLEVTSRPDLVRARRLFVADRTDEDLLEVMAAQRLAKVDPR